jgi:hypothetical protein
LAIGDKEGELALERVRQLSLQVIANAKESDFMVRFFSFHQQLIVIRCPKVPAKDIRWSFCRKIRSRFDNWVIVGNRPPPVRKPDPHFAVSELPPPNGSHGQDFDGLRNP